MADRVLTINGCGECPHYVQNYKTITLGEILVMVDLCRLANITIPEEPPIPDWCPLPEAK